MKLVALYCSAMEGQPKAHGEKNSKQLHRKMTRTIFLENGKKLWCL